MSIAKGEPWGRPAEGAPDLVLEGGDDTLASAVAAYPHARIEFVPAAGSDFARAVGLSDGGRAAMELPCDALRVDVDGRELLAVNMVVVGVPPDRQRWWNRASRIVVQVDDRVVHDGDAVAVVVANGQYLRGADVVPRGHPGDGRIEIQVYAVGRRERAAMRARLRLGTHVPHPRIRSTAGRRVEIRAGGPALGVEIDGIRAAPARAVTVAVAPAAFTLLV
jgi:YegS C-terminal NAD kinase beta sandwich-like domain